MAENQNETINRLTFDFHSYKQQIIGFVVLVFIAAYLKNLGARIRDRIFALLSSHIRKNEQLQVVIPY